jgi:hypothetical protein
MLTERSSEQNPPGEPWVLKKLKTRHWSPVVEEHPIRDLHVNTQQWQESI